MKTLRLFITLFFFLAWFTGIGQVTNGSFESWTSGEPDSWVTNNSVIATITQSNDAHGGSSAARCEVGNFQGTIITPFLTSGPSGFPMTQSYPSITGWFKGTTVSGELVAMTAAVYDASSTAVGYAFLNIPVTGTWQQFTLTLIYTGGTPSYGQMNFTLLDGIGNPSQNVGSFFILDDLEITGATGISKINSAIFNVSPNPTSDKINISGDFAAGEIMNIELINSIGQTVLNTTAEVISNGALPPIDISQFPAGNYIVNVSDSKKSFTKHIVINE